MVRGAQDQSIQQEIALQERFKDPEGTRGKTSRQIFDDILIADLEKQAAAAEAAGDDLSAARFRQQIEDIKAPGLEELTKISIDIQRQQLDALLALAIGDER